MLRIEHLEFGFKSCCGTLTSTLVVPVGSILTLVDPSFSMFNNYLENAPNYDGKR